MLGATVLVPVLVAAHSTGARLEPGDPRPAGDRRREVLASIIAGAIGVLAMQLTVGNQPGSLATPASIGVLAAGSTYLVARLWRRVGRHVRRPAT